MREPPLNRASRRLQLHARTLADGAGAHAALGAGDDASAHAGRHGNALHPERKEEGVSLPPLKSLLESVQPSNQSNRIACGLRRSPPCCLASAAAPPQSQLVLRTVQALLSAAKATCPLCRRAILRWLREWDEAEAGLEVRRG